MGYAVMFLLLLAVVVLCITGFVAARLLLSGSGPELPPFAGGSPQPSATGPKPVGTKLPGDSSQVRVNINPTQGFINTLVTVTGEGWWSGEPVFIFLHSQGEGDGPGYAYAAAVADDRGNFYSAFTFPNEMRWIGEPWADVIARGTRSGMEAGTRFTLVPPTPTNTLPPPTPRPTSAITDTPSPTDTLPPSDTPTPEVTPTPDVIITDWRGEYFANASLAGAPTLIRNDQAIDFNWGAGSPDPGLPVDFFSARWTRDLKFSKGAYRVSITADDGVRFWMDGQILVDEWHDASSAIYTVDLYVSKGWHNLHLEYYEGTGGAMVQFKLTKPEAPTDTPTPSPTPSPTPTPTPTPEITSTPTVSPSPTLPPSSPLPGSWQAAYFDNPALFGEPVLTREDAEINFNWGVGSPDPILPFDGFSARWTGEAVVSTGHYRYYLTADDGARLSIDGHPLINAWPANPGQVYPMQVFLSEGTHSFVVEYFEGFGDASVHVWGEAVVGP